MIRTIAQRDLRNRNAEIMDAVEAGETFVITRNGAAVAELRPLPRGRRQAVPRAEFVAMLAQGPRLDVDAFQRDLDTTFDQRLHLE